MEIQNTNHLPREFWKCVGKKYDLLSFSEIQKIRNEAGFTEEQLAIFDAVQSGKYMNDDGVMMSLNNMPRSKFYSLKKCIANKMYDMLTK